ncbi:SdpI family protein [Lacinutrix himadriensis]|uniref:SdpI family protein n=1 Tax=Lacinutrix himadriensis TaxID=641549 RepID=UPI0006E363E0|nr:SdpI family protein [Lacinutrix himadriensis]
MISLDFLLEIPALVGIIFIITGILMQVFPPKKINPLYGYRTRRSMQNQQKWDFSQKYSAKLLAVLGLALVLISTLNIFFTIPDDLEKIISAILIIGSVIFLVIKTESKLKDI